MAMGGDKLRALCVGHPAATIAWPHRELHEVADQMDRITLALRQLQERGAYDNVMHAHSRVSLPGDVWRELAAIYFELIEATPHQSLQVPEA